MAIQACLTVADRLDRKIDDRKIDEHSSQWAGPSSFSSMIEELVLDWGTGLDQSLYAEAIIHELGGADAVISQLPMQLNGLSLGNQR